MQVHEYQDRFQIASQKDKNVSFNFKTSVCSQDSCHDRTPFLIGEGPNLTLPSPQDCPVRADDGYYYCIAHNIAGIGITQPVNVIVEGPFGVFLLYFTVSSCILRFPPVFYGFPPVF